MRYALALYFVLVAAGTASAACEPAMVEDMKTLGCADYQISRSCSVNDTSDLGARILSEKFAANSSERPQEGVLRRYTNDDPIASFKVKTPNDGESYFIKLKDAQTHEDVLSMFVYPGQTGEADVPIGTFEMVYAYGPRWLNETLLFGICGTHRAKADDTLVFRETDEGVSVITIELIKQEGGNLSTTELDDDANF